MKIKVRSKYAEALALTGRTFDTEGKVHLQFRQFLRTHPKSNYGEVYMTPAEAAFLVESTANKAHIDAGEEAPYAYPAGYPLPLPDNQDGPLLPPLTEASFSVTDPRQQEAALEYIAARDEAMAKGKTADTIEPAADTAADRAQAARDRALETAATGE